MVKHVTHCPILETMRSIFTPHRVRRCPNCARWAPVRYYRCRGCGYEYLTVG